MASVVPSILPPKLDRRGEFVAALTRRDWVINLVGLKKLESFEDWAFRNSPYKPGQMIYDGNIAFHWRNTHSTKGMPDNPDEVVKNIVRLWFTGRMSSAEDAWSTGEENA